MELNLKERLETLFNDAAKRVAYRGGTVLLWVGGEARNGTRHGSFKHINRRSLEGREYRLEFVDGQVSVFWTDVWFNPTTSKYEEKE